MTATRILKLVSYDSKTTELIIAVHDAIPFLKFCQKNRLEASLTINADGHLFVRITQIKTLKIIKIDSKVEDSPLGVELFLAEMKIAIDVYGEKNWVNFVSELREKAGIKPITILVDDKENGLQTKIVDPRLEGTTSFDTNLPNKIFIHPYDISEKIIQELDARSLASLQQVAFGLVKPSKVTEESKETKRNYTSMRPLFNSAWEKLRDEHYPYGQLPLNLDFTLPILLPEKRNYNASYFASAKEPRQRLLLHAVITGDLAAPVMAKLTEKELLNEDTYIRPFKQPWTLFAIAKHYKHKDLLLAWWDKYSDPLYKLDSSTFDLSKVNQWGETILDQATYYNSSMVPLLLKQGANPRAGKALDSAVICGDEAIVSLFIEKGVDVNQAEPTGAIAICTASKHGYSDIVSTLIKARANPNTPGPERTTALQHAAYRSHTACVRELLEAKASCSLDPNIMPTPPLVYATMNGDFDTLDLLLNAQEEAKLGEATNPLRIIFKGGNTCLGIALINRQEKIAQRLLESIAKDPVFFQKELLHKNKEGKCVFELAVAMPTLNILKQLLTLVVTRKTPVSNDSIEVILDKVKNDITILKLLELVPYLMPKLHEKITKLKKAADVACGAKLLCTLTDSPARSPVAQATERKESVIAVEHKDGPKPIRS